MHYFCVSHYLILLVYTEPFNQLRKEITDLFSKWDLAKIGNNTDNSQLTENQNKTNKQTNKTKSNKHFF